MRLEDEPGKRRLLVGGLCAVMGLLFLVALFVPFLRDFYELRSPNGEMVLAWAVGAGLGVVAMLAVTRRSRR
jgi:hypothetical protein